MMAAEAAAADGKLTIAHSLINELAIWIKEAFDHGSYRSDQFNTLYHSNALTATYDGFTTVTVEGAGYSFDVQKEESSTQILIRNGSIRVDFYEGQLPTASTKATLSLRVLLADSLQKIAPGFTVVCKLDDIALLTARPDTAGQGSGEPLTRPTLRWSTLSYILHGQSFYTYMSDGAFKLHSNDDEFTDKQVEDAIHRETASIREKLNGAQKARIRSLFTNPSQAIWNTIRYDHTLISNLTLLNTYLQQLDITYDYTANSPNTSIHQYFATENHQPGCWTYPPKTRLRL